MRAARAGIPRERGELGHWAGPGVTVRRVAPRRFVVHLAREVEALVAVAEETAGDLGRWLGLDGLAGVVASPDHIAADDDGFTVELVAGECAGPRHF